MPCDSLQAVLEIAALTAELCQHGVPALRARDQEPARWIADVGEFHVVHDDEAVEVGHQRGDLVAAVSSRMASASSEDGEQSPWMRPWALSTKL